MKIVKSKLMIDTPYLSLLNTFTRMRYLNGLDKLSIYEEYKEWIIDDYNSYEIFFVREEPIL